MRIKVPTSLKKQVAIRADKCCEYCLLPERVSFYSFHIDHIKSLKHGGLSDLQNLAYCCPDCNFHKGSDVGTFSANEKYLVRFFNPRNDIWSDHFLVEDGLILGKTEIGQSTVQIFQFNEIDRLLFRRNLISLRVYQAF